MVSSDSRSTGLTRTEQTRKAPERAGTAPGGPVRVTAPAVLGALVSEARVVLWDFDGPICRLFAHLHADKVADELRGLVGYEDDDRPEIDDLRDPLAVYTRIHEWYTSRRPELVVDIRLRLEGLETEAVGSAEPTPGSEPLMRALGAAGKRQAIATNNSRRAVDSFLQRHELAGHFTEVAGRPDDPAYMKPHPYSLQLLLERAGTPPAESLMIGDSPADVGAAAALGVPFVGYSVKPHKLKRLQDAGATYFVQDLALLAEAVGPGGDTPGPVTG